MRTRRAVLTAALLGCLSAAALVAVTARGDALRGSPPAPLAAQADCDVGGAPTQPYQEHPPERFLRYGTRPVVIGCAVLPSARRFELVGYQLGRGERTELCIDQYDFDTDVSWGCGSNMVRGGGAIDATSRQQTAGRAPVVAGTVAPSVARVVVRSEIGGRLRRHPAALVEVRDADLLRAIGVRTPFGRYLAEVPVGARDASAEALGARGRTLGLAFFPGFRGPVGEGRACYSRPRVTRMRLLDPARIGQTSRLQIVATYPGGYIGSMDVKISGRGGAHADLVGVRPRRDGGRRVVTLPVSFTRRGATGVDVTAEGLPLSKRCGSRPLPRRSAPKTLVVRVSGPAPVAPRAKLSVETLPARERSAAQALVRLESAARARDSERLCQSVYVFAGGPSPGCEDSMRRLFPTKDGYAIAVRSVRFSGPRRALAAAEVVVVGARGRKRSYPHSTFQLARRAGVWHVVFIT